AATDISDSLSIDLSLMAAASGVGVVLQAEQIPIAEAAYQLAKTSGLTPLEHALTDGEDFELLLCVSPEVASALHSDASLANDLFEIGEFIAEQGLFLQAKSGARRILEPRGYSH
ncbi:MAG TPA: AIR synthase-related protein, partial [Pirellulaceae bacterium]|nr:AIR synthase-related protein [Pirellulaceae bacterium]